MAWHTLQPSEPSVSFGLASPDLFHDARRNFKASRDMGFDGSAAPDPVSPTPSAPLAFSRGGVAARIPAVQSDAYLAALRRRDAQAIRLLFRRFIDHRAEPDSVLHVSPVVGAIAQALSRMAGDPREGNARELLRRLRDTLLNGRWINYREGNSHLAAGGALELLCQTEHVSKQDVRHCSAEMKAGGLDLLRVPLLGADEDVEEAAGEDG